MLLNTNQIKTKTVNLPIIYSFYSYSWIKAPLRQLSFSFLKYFIGYKFKFIDITSLHEASLTENQMNNIRLSLLGGLA